jgi:DNA-binding Lrp family transcriptional regulator
MRRILVMIKCRLGAAYAVAGQIVDDVENAGFVYSVSGQYDLIAQFNLDPAEDIGRFVNEKVHAIDGIVDTHTLICFNAFSKDRGIADEG